MRKIVILLFIIICFTGCKTQNIDNWEIEDITKNVLLVDNKMSNTSLSGYEFYLPKSMILVNEMGTNSVLLDEHNYYYLYVDLISSYHKVGSDYVETKDAYYSEKIENNDKKGYIEINEVEDKYFIEIMYNYAKIEAYVNKEDIKETLINAETVLASVSYNTTIIESLIGDNVLNYNEETFNIFKPKREEGNFLDYVKEDIYEDTENELPNEDNIIIDSEIE